MSFKIKTSDPFDAEVKRLSKKYRSLKLDLHALGKELMENPFQGVEIAPNIRKVRLAISSKGRGKSGGARVITYNRLTTLPPYLLTLGYMRFCPFALQSHIISNATRCVPTLIAGQGTEGSRCCFCCLF